MTHPQLPDAAVCAQCGADSKPRGKLWGRDFFLHTAELILMLWIHCPNCGDVTQPVDAIEVTHRAPHKPR